MTRKRFKNVLVYALRTIGVLFGFFLIPWWLYGDEWLNWRLWTLDDISAGGLLAILFGWIGGFLVESIFSICTQLTLGQIAIAFF